ncbi:MULTISPECIES: hypothetical protein [Sphingomonas]|jgi:hypothetical protein|uniref:hypothetical protein n=1 Tax=Sphingomonas TaxID=13687 RepID=UPI0025503B66|nr:MULTISPECIES: hypothetical protein [Sphingomonas]MDK8188165.1 hypothetical protein [Sphingomonas zeae]MDK8217838.1 hypothetical protein [Sphingomonas sp. UMB7805-LC452B]
MSPTVTHDHDSEPGSWARRSLLANLSRKTVSFKGQVIANFLGANPPAPTCATCGSVLCGCPDHHWKG